MRPSAAVEGESVAPDRGQAWRGAQGTGTMSGADAVRPMVVRRTPLCVDLDGTLARTDLLWESLLSNLRARPWVLVQLPFWLMRGRASLKARLAEGASIDFARIPYRAEVLAMIRARRGAGDPVVLTTASTQRIADGVAGALDIFDEVIASDERRNVKGRRKAAVLVERFGRGGFDYVGDSAADDPVWREARNAFVAGPNAKRLMRRAGTDLRIEPVPPTDASRPGAVVGLLRALRVHQWVKNLLVFVPLLASHRLAEAAAATWTLLAFAAFCLCASSAYVVNDLLDIQADRAHGRKHRRPFASGEIPIWAGFALAPTLLAAAAATATWLPATFQTTLLAYFVLTLAYSLWFKAQLGVDVIVLAGLYTIRIVGGGHAAEIVVSSWLLLFSMFLFFSLALLKRYAELLTYDGEGGGRPVGRGYEAGDRAVVLAVGAAAGLIAVLVLALYVNGESAGLLYASPEALLLLCPLMMYWIGRMWILAGRGTVHEDPVLFAARDPATYVVAALAGVVLWLATVA